MYQKLTILWKPLLIFGIVGVLAAACTQPSAQPAQVQQRETIQQEKKACTEPEFRRLPYGLEWPCPPGGEVKLPIGTGIPVNIPKLLAAEDTKDAKRGGILRRTAVSTPLTGTEDAFRHTCCSQPWISLGETLVRRTAAPEYKVVPNLAESWDAAKDGLTYTFKLRQGVKFHNKPPADGRELEAKDVVDTYTYAMGWKHKGRPTTVRFTRAGALANLEKIDAVDKYTVKFTLSSPNADFLIGLTDQRVGIFPEGLIEFNGGDDMNNFPKTGVSTGPFVMVDHDTKTRSVWKKHPSYWDVAPDGKPYPYLDEIRLERVGDLATARAAFIAGQLDLFETVGDDDIESVQKARPNVKVATIQGGPRTYNLVNYKNTQYNETPGAWTKQETRWALQLVKDMCKYGQTIQPISWRYQLFWGYWFPESRSQEELSMMPGLRCQTPEIKKQDRLKGVELLKQAGYAKGFKMLDYESESASKAGGANWVYGEIMHADLNKVLPGEYGLTEWDGRHKPGVIPAETARIEEQQLYDLRTQCSLNDVTVSVVLYQDWYTGGGRNYEGHSNNWNNWWKEMYPDPKDGMDNMTWDKMWQRQAGELDPEKRMRLVRIMEHYLIWNMAWVPMNGSLAEKLAQPHVMAFGPNWELGIDGGVEKALKWTWLNK